MHFLDQVSNWLLPTVYAQISTSTAGTLIDTTITDGGTLLSVTLLKIFGFAMALAIIVFVFWFVLSRVRRPR